MKARCDHLYETLPVEGNRVSRWCLLCPSMGGVVWPSKSCGKCRHWYTHEAFCIDSAHRSGLQSYCRMCKAAWETFPRNAWKRFESFLKREEPHNLGFGPDQWNEALYLAAYEKSLGLCSYCGQPLHRYAKSGHGMDREVNEAGHAPSNCRFACHGCNWHKRNMPIHAFLCSVEDLMARHPNGIPWDAIYQGRVRRCSLPDVSRYRIDPPASSRRREFRIGAQLFLFGGDQ